MEFLAGAKESFDLVFLDPPYASGLVVGRVSSPSSSSRRRPPAEPVITRMAVGRAGPGVWN